MIKVRAKEMVYYGHKRRREGDVFILKDESHFSKKSMEKLGSSNAVSEVEVEDNSEAEAHLLDEDVI